MLKSFYLGIILGAGAAAAAVYFYPAVNLHREHSLVQAHANGGYSESFHIEVPSDRIMAGVAGLPETTPPGLDWPDYDFLANIRTELFKVRNEKGVVIGAASRLYGSSELHGPFVEWTVHLPARGTLYMTMEPDASSEGHRDGMLRAGTRDFETLNGTIVERFVAVDDDPDSGSVGRLELVTTLVGPTVDEE